MKTNKRANKPETVGPEKDMAAFRIKALIKKYLYLVGIVEETDKKNLIWKDERPNSGVVLFSTFSKQRGMNLVISALPNGRKELVLSIDRLSHITGQYFRGKMLEPLVAAIERQLNLRRDD